MDERAIPNKALTVTVKFYHGGAVTLSASSVRANNSVKAWDVGTDAGNKRFRFSEVHEISVTT